MKIRPKWKEGKEKKERTGKQQSSDSLDQTKSSQTNENSMSKAGDERHASHFLSELAGHLCQFEPTEQEKRKIRMTEFRRSELLRAKASFSGFQRIRINSAFISGNNLHCFPVKIRLIMTPSGTSRTLLQRHVWRRAAWWSWPSGWPKENWRWEDEPEQNLQLLFFRKRKDVMHRFTQTLLTLFLLRFLRIYTFLFCL